MKISVVVPTYKRVNELRRCLDALKNQTSLPYEVIVVVKSFDIETLSYIKNWTSEQSSYFRKVCTVTLSGVVHAMTQGVKVASGEVVAFTDDDSAPDPTWLSKMEQYYQNPKVGGVGGRDILIDHPVVSLKKKVGELTWYGKLIGNHHLGVGLSREVDVLKGVNMSFRRNLVAFTPFLRGSGGPENHNEIGLCLRIKRLGYLLVYDPTIIVNHHVAPRIDSEQRTQFNAKSVENSAFNIQISLLLWLPWYQKLVRLIYSALIGDKAYPGLVRVLIALMKRETSVINCYLPAQVGYQIAIVYYLRRIFRIGGKASPNFSELNAQQMVSTEDVHVRN